MKAAIDRLCNVGPGMLDTSVEQRQTGRVEACVGLGLTVRGLNVSVGRFVEVEAAGGRVPAQVVGFRSGATLLMPLDVLDGVFPGAQVQLTQRVRAVDAGDAIGRILNARGEPMDGGPSLRQPPLQAAASAINPLERPPIDTALDVGVRSINALLTVGRGQRLGLFAGSGVGKSVLLGMLARMTKADVVVVGLIGERGREVREFIHDNLGEGLAHSVVVASPADDSPALRLRGAWLATELAEQYRAAGKHVLLLIDSLTRCAQAQREIGLALGEPGTSKGYPPSAFAVLPKLVERAGTTEHGSITAFYTVLMEEDDLQDPVVDASRAILDGHIVLDRSLADAGVYPAINISASVSRVMSRVTTPEQAEAARRFKALWARYAEQSDLISVGAYQRGSDPATDLAIALHDAQLEFLRQAESDAVSIPEANTMLDTLLAPPAALPVAEAAGG